MKWNAARFTHHMRFHQELTNIVEQRSKEILERLGKHGWLKDYDEYNVTMERNSSCHCHPDYREFTFPADWLFAEDWQKQVDAVVAKEKADHDAAARKNAEIKERQDREEFERWLAGLAILSPAREKLK